MSDIAVSKSYNIDINILNKYNIEAVSSVKHKAEPYKYNELNTMTYNAINIKKYNNLLYDKTSGLIPIDLTLNKTYSEVIICNKLV